MRNTSHDRHQWDHIYDGEPTGQISYAQHDKRNTITDVLTSNFIPEIVIEQTLDNMYKLYNMKTVSRHVGNLMPSIKSILYKACKTKQLTNLFDLGNGYSVHKLRLRNVMCDKVIDSGRQTLLDMPRLPATAGKLARKLDQRIYSLGD